MSGLGICILIWLFCVMVVFPYIRYCRSKKIKKHKEYSSKYPHTVKKYEDLYRSRGFYYDRIQVEIGAMEEYYLAYEESIVNNYRFLKEVENNPKRAYYHQEFLVDSILESIIADRSTDLSTRITNARKKMFELQSNDDAYKKYILSRLESLDQYITIREKYEFIKRNYSSALEVYLKDHINSKYQIVANESEIIKIHKAHNV